MLASAIEYGLEGLVQCCVAYITEGLQVDTACEAIQAAITYNQDDLRDSCMDFIEKNTLDVRIGPLCSHFSATFQNALLHKANMSPMSCTACADGHVGVRCVGVRPITHRHRHHQNHNHHPHHTLPEYSSARHLAISPSRPIAASFAHSPNTAHWRSMSHEQVFKSPHYAELSEDTLAWILQSDRLQADEPEIYAAMREWGTVNMVVLERPMADVIASVVEHVRFPLLSTEQLTKIEVGWLSSLGSSLPGFNDGLHARGCPPPLTVLACVPGFSPRARTPCADLILPRRLLSRPRTTRRRTSRWH